MPALLLASHQSQRRPTSTATITTLLYKRGYHNAFVQGVAPLGYGKRPLIGPAYTLRYSPARPDTDPIEAFREPDHPQRLAVEECPAGAVLVMDCRQDASAASAGSILLTRLQVRGAAGVVTDGGIRDAAGAAALDMPVFAAKPSAPTNLTKHHAVDIGLPIACGGVAVYPGDIVLGDGVMVIPRHLADAVAEECSRPSYWKRSAAAFRSAVSIRQPTPKRWCALRPGGTGRKAEGT